MSAEERLRVGQRVRHITSGDGLGMVVDDNGEPEDRGAYLVKFDNGAEYQTSRSSLEVVPETLPIEKDS
jgi:hypothetical protein